MKGHLSKRNITDLWLSFVLFFFLSQATDGEGNDFPLFQDWKNVSRDLGWSPFNAQGEPFSTLKNTDFCDLRTRKVSVSECTPDCSAAINKAFEWLRLRDTPGGTVLLDKGTYPVSHQVKIHSYSCLVGAGMNKTRIRLIDDAPAFARAGLVRTMKTVHVTVQDLTIDGNMFGQKTRNLTGDGYGRFGLFTQLTNYMYVNRVRVLHNLGYGFDPHGDKNDWGNYLIIDECEAVENGMDGFTIDQTMYALVRNSVSFKNARHGFNVVTGTRYLNAVGNTAKYNGKYNLFLQQMEAAGFEIGPGCSFTVQNNLSYGTEYANISKNTLLNPEKGGLCLNDVGNIVYKENKIKNKDKDAYCYHFTKTHDVLVKDSKCEAEKKVQSIDGAKFTFKD